MVINLNKTVGIVGTVCLSAALQFGANAQSQTSPVQLQNQAAKASSSNSSDPQSNLDSNKLALANDVATKAKSDDKANLSRESELAEPKIKPKTPTPNFKVTAKESKYTGVYKVEDTGRVIKGNIVDVWVPDNREARQFGRRKIQLHVLKMGPSKNRKR
jgi:3D (Asp-Asp-Asp) domain-containing protein